MDKTRIVVKYHIKRMLLTVDLNNLFGTLFDAYGDDVTVGFVAMNEREWRESMDESGEIPMVRDRFQVFEE